MTDREHLTLTLVFEDLDDSGWVQARIEEFPEVVTAAPERDEARVMVLDALAQYLASFPEAEGYASGLQRALSAH
jgi:hypothetical protein